MGFGPRGAAFEPSRRELSPKRNGVRTACPEEGRKRGEAPTKKKKQAGKKRWAEIGLEAEQRRPARMDVVPVADARRVQARLEKEVTKNGIWVPK